MERFDKKTELMLSMPLPPDAVKPHPTKRNMSAINPIYVSERLNKVFGIGGWGFSTSNEDLKPWTQTTKNGERAMFRGIVKCELRLSNGALYQTTASSDNDDAGDALKGAATDGLTKLASWLGVGSHVWKNLDYDQAYGLWRREWDKHVSQKPKGNPAIEAIKSLLTKGSEEQKAMIAKVLSSGCFGDDYCINNGLENRDMFISQLNRASNSEEFSILADKILIEVQERKKAYKSK